MKIPLFQLDSFSDQAFGGNPAAVCPLDDWLPDETLQAIAIENNLSETAFIVEAGASENDSEDESDDFDYHLRWFTPGCEVDFCGHATLASGQVVLSTLRPELSIVRFSCRAGIVSVSRSDENDGKLHMDAPNRKPDRAEPAPGLIAAMGAAPEEVWYAEVDNFMLVYRDAATVAALTPDFGALKACGKYGVIATAPGASGDCDFVSRYFVPSYGIDEDPVTGSAHCTSAPYWAERLGKNELFARQISARGGEIWLVVSDDRVRISGHCVPVIEGVLTI